MASSSAGELLQLIRSGKARTRAELQRLTGLSRSTVWQRLDRLIEGGYLYEPGVDESTGGRPPTILEFNDQHGMVLAGHLGANHARVALLDLSGAVLAEETAELPVAKGPKQVLDWVGEHFLALLHETGQATSKVAGIGLGVPGPVEFQLGRLNQPPIMPGWDGYPVIDHLRGFIDVPVLVDNDANLMALGEQSVHYRDSQVLVLVKVATGIGAGIVIDGQVYRGVDGGAGDIGHVRLAGHDDVLCMCGSHGCLTAVASGSALAERLSASGPPTTSSREFLGRLAEGRQDAGRLAREAGATTGEVLATVVSLINPGVLVIAGDLAETNFLTGVREALYRTALPRSTRHLTVTTSQLGDNAGVVGAHVMVVDSVYSPEAVDRRLREAAP